MCNAGNCNPCNPCRTALWEADATERPKPHLSLWPDVAQNKRELLNSVIVVQLNATVMFHARLFISQARESQFRLLRLRRVMCRYVDPIVYCPTTDARKTPQTNHLAPMLWNLIRGLDPCRLKAEVLDRYRQADSPQQLQCTLCR